MTRPRTVISVSVTASGWRAALPGPAAVCRRAARAALAAADAPRAVEISIVLAGDDFVRGLNRDWRRRDEPTNVLAFPAGDGPGAPGAPVMLGDVAVALETTLAEAARDGKTAEAHLSHLIAHGVLHLLGFDHETDAEAEAMEGTEARALAQIGIENPYAADHPFPGR